MIALWLLACAPPATEQPIESASPPEFQYSFAILADPHVTSNPDPQERLARAVDWVNANAAERQIELVWVLGDIGWGAGLAISKELLDALEPLWLPVLGDNEVVFGDEENFELVYGPQIQALSEILPGWSRGQVEVYNPTYERTSWLQNYAFTYGGVRWVALDWCSRSDNTLLSELGELQDFEGGTLPYLDADLGALGPGLDEDVLLFSHHPMHLGTFNQAQMEALTAVTGPLASRVAGAYAGHAHVNAEIEVEEGGYTAWVTDAVWDDVITVRVVDVYRDGDGFSYEQELVVVE